MILGILIVGTVLFAQYQLEKTVFSPGSPNKSDGGSYILFEECFSQTVSDTIFNGSRTIQQGYIHRPIYLVMNYTGIPTGPGDPVPILEPGTGWYEPTGSLSVHAQDTILSLDGNTKYTFVCWTTTTGAEYNHVPSPDSTDTITYFPFYQSHEITAVYSTQHKVTFHAVTKNEDVYGALGSSYFDSLNSSNYVRVSYWNRGSNVETGDIWDKDVENPQTVWADEDSPYVYWDTSSGGSATERWYVDYADPDRAADITAAGDIYCDYYMQFLCEIDVVYDPTGFPVPAPGAGVVQLVEWHFCNADSTGPPPEYDEQDDWDSDDGWGAPTGVPHWADVGSRLTFPEQTTGGWGTVNIRDWVTLDKTLEKTIIYGQPMVAELAAQRVMWRGYTLMGVPLYPMEDTTAYKVFCSNEGLPAPSGQLNRGDQDVIIYDDLHTDCDGSPADSNAWQFEDWWRVTKYYPEHGIYRRYVGPGRYYDSGNIEPFWPGRGFWFVQDHCDSLMIDEYGMMADTLQPYAIGLRRSGADDYTCYNMIANPFYHGTVGTDDVLVYWHDALVWKADDVAPLDSDPETLSIADAAIAGWIAAAAHVYRDAIYISFNAGLPGIPPNYEDTLFEWEGFWVRTNNAEAEDVGDSLVLLMRVNSLAGSKKRARPSPDDELVEFWSVPFRAECEALGQRDIYNSFGFKEYNAHCERKVLSAWEMPEFTYPEPQLRVFFVSKEKGNNGEFAQLCTDDRRSVMSWNAVLDCRAIKGEKVRVSWDVSDVPPGFNLYLRDSDHDVWLDMFEQSDYSFNSTGDMHLVEITTHAPLTWVNKEHLKDVQVPDKFYLNAPAPNPFNASCRLEFGLARGDEGYVNIAVYDVLGRRVNTLLDGDLEPGNYDVTWLGDDTAGRRVSSGTYFIRFIGAGRTISRKVSLVK